MHTFLMFLDYRKRNAVLGLRHETHVTGGECGAAALQVHCSVLEQDELIIHFS